MERISRLFTASFIKAGGFPPDIPAVQKIHNHTLWKSHEWGQRCTAPHSSKMTDVSDKDSIFYIQVPGLTTDITTMTMYIYQIKDI